MTLTGAETVTIAGLPAGVTYTVTEAVLGQFTTIYAGETGELPIGGTATVTVTNTRKVGPLKIQKTVISANDADDKIEFHFTVTLKGLVEEEKTYEAVKTTADGKEEKLTVKFTKGVSEEITLKHNESIVISGLPVGIEYSVAESEANTNNFVTTSVGETGTLCLAESIAAFTNTKVEGGLMVTKKVISALESDYTAKYTIVITLNNTTINGTYGEATFTAGVATVQLADGESIVVTGLPVGIGYTVTETAPGDAWTVTYTGATGTIAENTVAHAVVTNTRKTTDLTISKKVVSGIAGDADEAFLFTITLSPALTGDYAGVYFEGGKAQIWLKHGQSLTLKGLPYGTTYTVTEEPDDRFEVSVTGNATGTLTNSPATVEFTNTRLNGRLRIRKTFEGISPYENVSNLKFRIIGPNGFDQTITYAQFTNGVYTFEDIPLGDYVVYETNAAYISAGLILLEGSTTLGYATVTANSDEIVEIHLINKYESSTTSVMVMKVWDDENNADGSRPESIVVSLMNKKKVVTTVTLNENNDWMAEVDDLPLYDGNTLIEYTWREETVTGYTLADTTTMGNITVLTNSHTPDLISTTVVKVWNDNDDYARVRPTVLRVTLSNGIGGTSNYYLTPANNWTVTVSNLPRFDNGRPLTYTWSEQAIAGYTQTDVTVTGNTTTFTNTYSVPVPPGPIPTTIVIEEYDTPLGVEVLINHVGDCFD